jgi:hypothetical protein
MSSLTPEWNSTFENWQPIRRAEFPCPWCNRAMKHDDSRWSHTDGRPCIWSDMPLEISHPFVHALLVRISTEVGDISARMTEFGRVLCMFSPSTPSYRNAQPAYSGV